jgi:hypothetical protein
VAAFPSCRCRYPPAGRKRIWAARIHRCECVWNVRRGQGCRHRNRRLERVWFRS